MDYNIDARISVEEFYGEPLLIECDSCQELSFPEDLHFMDNFDDKPVLVICHDCYQNLLNNPNKI